MSGESDQFKRSLLRMLQTGTFQPLLGCEEGQGATVEFHEQTMYRIRLNRRTIVVTEREVEIIRRHVNGRWQRMRPTVVSRGRIVIDRATGKILASPSLGVITPAASSLRRGAGKPQRLALARTT